MKPVVDPEYSRANFGWENRPEAWPRTRRQDVRQALVVLREALYSDDIASSRVAAATSLLSYELSRPRPRPT